MEQLLLGLHNCRYFVHISGDFTILLCEIPAVQSGSPNLSWLALLRMPSEALEGVLAIHQCRPQAASHTAGFGIHILCVASTHSRGIFFFLARSSSSSPAFNSAAATITYRRYMYTTPFVYSRQRVRSPVVESGTAKCV